MGFATPLKAFVSYSHEDADLCRAFLAQIKSLMDDGILDSVWTDGQIRAGMKWDEEIRRGLDEAHLFIALTSAQFNFSKYIEGVEMKHAEERHKAGTCRMVPIMLRSWVPPKRFQQYQFLPNLKQSVASSRKRDDVWAAIVGKLQDVVDEMVSGKWPRPASSSPASSPAALADRLDPFLGYLCNWSDPISQIKKGLRFAEGQQRRPCVAILVATREDAYERFIVRVAGRDLPKALGLEGLVPEIKRFDWCSAFDEEIHAILEAGSDRPVDKKLREGLTVLETTEEGDDWTAAKESLLTDFLRYFRGWPTLPVGWSLVSVVSIVLSQRNPDFLKKIVELVSREANEAVPAVVVEIPKVPYKHVYTWVTEPEVKKRYRAEAEQDLIEDIQRLFPQINEPMPMAVLAPKLLGILRRYQ